jgi:hypothetical protein
VSLEIGAIMNALESHALASGVFEDVLGHELIGMPGTGITAALWPQRIRPVALASGLAATSARVEFMLRIYTTAVQQPADGIDPAVVAAADALFTAYGADFELGGNARNVDLLGQTGEPLSATAGWLQVDGGSLRVMDLLIPVVVNDVWSQSP